MRMEGYVCLIVMSVDFGIETCDLRLVTSESYQPDKESLSKQVQIT